jgi:DnaJ domain
VTVQEAYDELGIDAKTATPGDVRSTFHSLVLLWHPDTISDTAAKPAATEKMMRLNEAYRTLKAAAFPRYTVANLKPVWSAQYDAGDAAFEKWFRDLDLGSIHSSPRRTFSRLTQLERTTVVAVAVAILIGFGILVKRASEEISAWLAWRQRCPFFASTAACSNQPNTEALASTLLLLFLLSVIAMSLYSQGETILLLLRHVLRRR